MPEKLPLPEQHEALSIGGEHLLPDAAHAEKLRPGEADPLAPAKARKIVEQHVGRPNQTNPFERLDDTHKVTETRQALPINQELKRITLRRELSQIHRQLPVADRLLSKIIHQPIVRRASEVTSKTVTRPSGLLGGGLVAFVGSSGYLYLAKYLGFTYNYGVLWLLLVVGFGIGLLFELIIRLLFRRP